MELFTSRRIVVYCLVSYNVFILTIYIVFVCAGKSASAMRTMMMSDIAKMNRIVLHAEINTEITDATPNAPPRTGLTALMHLMTLRDTQAGFSSINEELELEEHLVCIEN